MANDLTPSSPIPAAPLPDENLQKPVNPGKSRYFPEILDPDYKTWPEPDLPPKVG